MFLSTFHLETKGIEVVKLPRIFHFKSVIETFPFKLKDRTADIPTVTYSYENPTGCLKTTMQMFFHNANVPSH